MAKGNTSVFEWRTGAAPSVSCVHVGGEGGGGGQREVFSIHVIIRNRV